MALLASYLHSSRTMLNPLVARRHRDQPMKSGPPVGRHQRFNEFGSATSAAFGALLLLAFLFLVAIEQLQPPAAAPASAPSDHFSASRAIDNLRVIAREPHPVGSAANARVREYLTSELTALGLHPEIQTTSVARTEPKWGSRIIGATVSNIMVRLPGSASTRPLMLAAHYDSVPGGPGASDDGSGVVTLLETARALGSGPPLRNDVIFLFTDAEEAGLLGAQAFVNEHAWAHQPGVVLNFEARGACGPSVMFETSAENGWLVREFAEASPDPVASSFSYEAYKRLPNDTDLTVFKRAGLAGLNFAYVGCFPRYHTREDSVDNLDPRSLQQDGSYALALARTFGNLDLNRVAAPDNVFFSLGHWVVRYPLSWTLPIFALTLLISIFAIATGFRRGRLQVAGVVAGLAGWLVAAGASPAVTHVLWSILRDTRFVSRLPYGTAYNGDYYVWAFVALTVAVVSAVFALLFRRFNVESLAVGTLGWWLALSALTAFAAPGASYLFLWPLLASFAELAYAFTRRLPEDETSSVLFWTLPAVVGILLVGSLPYQLMMLLSTVLLAPVVIVTALVTGFLVPHLHILTLPRRWWLSGGAALAAIGLIAAGMATAGYSSNRPRADSIFYAMDADRGSAIWGSADAASDDWTRQFLQGRVENGNLTDWGIGPRAIVESPAPVLNLAGPTLVPFEDSIQDQTRRLGFDLHFAPGTSLVWLTLRNALVTSTTINGKPVSGFEPTPPTTPAADLKAAKPPENGCSFTLRHLRKGSKCSSI
jgi:hypothetical protein